MSSSASQRDPKRACWPALWMNAEAIKFPSHVNAHVGRKNSQTSWRSSAVMFYLMGSSVLGPIGIADSLGRDEALGLIKRPVPAHQLGNTPSKSRLVMMPMGNLS